MYARLFLLLDCQRTNGRTDGRTDTPSYRVARTHLKRGGKLKKPKSTRQSLTKGNLQFLLQEEKNPIERKRRVAVRHCIM